MSTYSSNVCHKRRSDDESSESDGEPPVKKLKSTSRETSTFPLSLLYLGESLASRWRQTYNWILDIPKKKLFRKRLMANEVITIDGGNEDGNEKEPDILEVAEIIRNNEIDLCDQEDQVHIPRGVSCSTPFYTDGTIVGFGRPNRAATNGFHGKSLKAKNNIKKSPKRQRSLDQRLTPLTNPALDVQILLDVPQISVDDDSDELQIISDISRGKLGADFTRVRPGRRFTVPIIPPVSPIECITVESNGYSGSKVRVGKDPEPSTSREVSATFCKEYTANQVVRLQEKEQYKLLLEKMMKISLYRPLKKKAAPIEVDLTSETEELAWSRPYKKELLQKPLEEFMDKHYMPMQVVTSTSPDPMSESSALSDEEIQIEDSIPTFKNAVIGKPNLSCEKWVNDLKKVISQETAKYMQVVKCQEDKMKRFRDRRDAKFEEERLLFEKLKIPGDVFAEKVTQDEFPELTAEMESKVKSLLRRDVGNETELITKYDDIVLLRKEFRTLNDETWLMDEILNSYLRLLMERSKLDNYPSLYCASTFLYTSFLRNPRMVMRWTRKVDIFSFDLICIPIHLQSVHWSLCVVDNRDKTIKYYDSLGGGNNSSVTETIRNYLIMEMQNKKNIVMNANEYTCMGVKNLPCQGNGSDCGMFTLKYAEYVSRDAPITFTQAHIPYFRRRMAWELLNHQLM